MNYIVLVLHVGVLFGKRIARYKMKRILSELHSVGTYDINKISLSCFDDRGYVLDDGINTLAHGHRYCVITKAVELLNCY